MRFERVRGKATPECRIAALIRSWRAPRSRSDAASRITLRTLVQSPGEDLRRLMDDYNAAGGLSTVERCDSRQHPTIANGEDRNVQCIAKADEKQCA